MKEFIEKLIDRLGEYKYSHLLEHNSEECLHCQENEDDWNCFNRNCLVCVCDRTISIINELAEEYKPKTQADKIRSMSDEELAEFFSERDKIPNRYKCKEIEDWIKWLKSEAE